MFNKGQGLVEYAMIMALVTVVAIVVLALLGPTIGNVFSDIVVALDTLETANYDIEDAEAPPDCYGSLLLPLLLASLYMTDWLANQLLLIFKRLRIKNQFS